VRIPHFKQKYIRSYSKILLQTLVRITHSKQKYIRSDSKILLQTLVRIPHFKQKYISGVIQKYFYRLWCGFLTPNRIIYN